MSAVTLEQVYASQDALFRSEQVPHHLSVLLSAAHADLVSVRALAAQAIPQWAHLHTQHELVLDAHIDLCEDQDAVVRLHAIRGLAVLCKGVPALTGKVADVLGQLAATGDAKERAAVKVGVAQAVLVDRKAALESLFRLVRQEVEVRDVLVPLLVEGVQEVKEEMIEWVGEQIVGFAKAAELDTDVLMQILQAIGKSKCAKEKKEEILGAVAAKWFVVQGEFDVRGLRVRF
jgi:hypothetical protein